MDYKTAQGEVAEPVLAGSPKKGSQVRVAGVVREVSSVRYVSTDGGMYGVVGLKRLGPAKQSLAAYRNYLASGAYDRDNGAY